MSNQLQNIASLVSRLNQKVKKITLYTPSDAFSSQDDNLRKLKSLNGMENYFTITFDNWDELSLGDFNKYQIDSDNETSREIEQINDLLENISFSVEELNNCIEEIIGVNNLKFQFN